MSDPKSTDCDDVEITPEMIEAGMRELLGFFSEDVSDTPRPIVIDIYRAMANLRFDLLLDAQGHLIGTVNGLQDIFEVAKRHRQASGAYSCVNRSGAMLECVSAFYLSERGPV